MFEFFPNQPLAKAFGCLVSYYPHHVGIKFDGLLLTLDSENKRRKSIDETTLKEALAMMDEICDLENEKAIILSSEGWHQGVIGIVASRLVERFHLPTILIAIDKGEGKGSARSIPGFHLTEALNKCENSLIRYLQCQIRKQQYAY